MRHFFVICVLCCGATLSPAYSLYADPEPASVEVPVVVVEPEPEEADTAAPSSVILRDQMSDAITDLPEVLEEQPGLRVTRMGGLGSFSSLSVRGSAGDQVVVYLDGIPLNAAEGGPVDLSAIPLGPLERVEVYRGVSPARFSRSAIGGVVSLHSRKDSQTELEVGGGSFGTFLARGYMGTGGGDWNLGVSQDVFTTQGDFNFFDDGGTRFDSSDDRVRPRENNAMKRFTNMVKAHYRVAEGVELQALNFFSSMEAGVPSLGLHPTEKSRVKWLRNLTGLGLKYEKPPITGGTLFLSPYFSWSRTSFDDPLGEVGLNVSESRDQTMVGGGTLMHRSPFALGSEGGFFLTHTFTAGFSYERFVPGVVGESAMGRESDRQRFSIVDELNFLWDSLDLEWVLGARYEHVLNDLRAPENRPGLLTNPVESASGDGATWRLGLVQRSIEDLSLKMNLSRSIRFPSLFELFGNTGAVLGNPSLGPESGLNADFGAVWAPSWVEAGESFTMEFFGFARWTEDLIVFIQNAQNVSIATNADAARIYGFEAGSYLDLYGHLRGRTSLTWMRSENQGEIKARKDKRLPQVPEWKGYARVEAYVKGRIGLDELGLYGDVDGLSGNYLDFANLVEVPRRILVGGGVYVMAAQRSLRMEVTLRNLLDDRVQDFSGFPLPGRSIMATFRWTPGQGGDRG